MDINYKVLCLSSHLAMPRVGYLETVYNIFGYISKYLESTLAKLTIQKATMRLILWIQIMSTYLRTSDTYVDMYL